RPVAALLPAPLAQPEEAPARKPPDALVERLVAAEGAVGEPARHRGLARRRGRGKAVDEVAELRREQQRATGLAEEDRARPQLVCRHQPLLPFVAPDEEGEGAADPRQQAVAEARERPRQHIFVVAVADLGRQRTNAVDAPLELARRLARKARSRVRAADSRA